LHRPTPPGDPYRADHLVEAQLEALLEDTKAPLAPELKREVKDLLAGVGEMDGEALGGLIQRFDIKAPDTKNELSAPFPFNLMFKVRGGRCAAGGQWWLLLLVAAVGGCCWLLRGLKWGCVEQSASSCLHLHKLTNPSPSLNNPPLPPPHSKNHPTLPLTQPPSPSLKIPHPPPPPTPPQTSIGPKGDMVGYLRPETAQGIFVNFRDLLYYNGSKLPFAAAQIGNSYRNEISPRAGLLRVREFTQAEIEHFVNPDDKSHPKFASVQDLQPLLYSRELQVGLGWGGGDGMGWDCRCACGAPRLSSHPERA